MPLSSHLPEFSLRSVFASVRASSLSSHGAGPGGRPVVPFITISRQAGAGAKTWAEVLIRRLNAMEAGRADSVPEEEIPKWTAWDRELVEKVAADLGTSHELISGLTDKNRSWLDRFFDDVSAAYGSHHASEFKIYRRVASTIRAMAQGGRVIIVGRGGVYLTHDMPGGLHLRLVAPLPDRIAAVEKRFGYSRRQAEEYVAVTDRAREKFCREHFPRAAFEPEAFSITFNTSAVSMDQMIDCVVACIYTQPAKSA